MKKDNFMKPLKQRHLGSGKILGVLQFRSRMSWVSGFTEKKRCETSIYI